MFLEAWKFRILVGICLLLILPAQPLNAQESASAATTNVEFIIDQSGSMGAATDTGVLRMDAAKSVFREVVQQIPDTGNINVGLRVYGHLGNNQPDGQAVSCQSTELLVPMDGVNHAALETTIAGLYPVGWTPIGLSLQQAGNDFPVPGPNDKNIIILITDGLETCGMDPAVEAEKLKNSDKAITTHVIGFGTSVDELGILESITQSSGGELIGSKNAAQLISAIFQILEDSNVVAVSGDGLSRESPLAIGRTGNIGDYDLTVVAVERDATDTVMATNQFNEPPGPDEQFFMVRVSATYTGDETGLPFLDLDFKAVGANNTSYSHLINYCGVIPDDPTLISEIFPGGTVEFNICWTIKSADADTLVMYVGPLFSGDSEPLWYAVGNPILNATTATPEPEPTSETVTQTTGTSGTPGEGATGDGEESAIPLGQVGKVGDYEVTVVSTTPYANDVVMAENMFNEVPAPDEQFYIVRVQVTYVGNSTGTPFIDLQANAVGELRTSYSTFQNSCGVIPDDAMMVSELFPGGSAEMNFCWKIKSADADSLVMYVMPGFMDEDRVWFRLAP